MKRSKLVALACLLTSGIAAAQTFPRPRARVGNTHGRGDGSSLFFFAPPSGPTDASAFRLAPSVALADQCTGNNLTGTRGETVTFTRASAAFCTKSDGSMVSLTNAKPRVEGQGVLFEKQGVNLVHHSQDFTNAVWNVLGTTKSGDGTTAPDGTATADRLTQTADNALHGVYNDTATQTTGNFTASVFAKQSGARYAALSNPGFTSWAKFDLQTGAVHSIGGAAISAAVVPSAQGFKRIAASWPTAGNSVNIMYGNDPATLLTSYAGDTNADIWVWGYQVEAGVVATSYVPTGGGTATRVADCAYTASTAAWPVAAGSIEVTWTPLWGTPSGADTLADARFTGVNSGFFNFLETAGNQTIVMGLFNASTGTTYNKSTNLTWTARTQYKTKVQWGSGDVTFYRDDVALVTRNGSNMPDAIAPTQVAIGCNAPFLGAGGELRGWVKDWAVFK